MLKCVLARDSRISRSDVNGYLYERKIQQGEIFMKDYTTANIRNIAVVGHGSDGKTTLVEALLYVTGAIDRQGRVEDGTATTDYDQEELKRHISISAAVAPLEFNETKITLIDVPGYFDFAGEMVGPMAVADGALITLSAVSGLDVGGEKAYALCEKHSLFQISGEDINSPRQSFVCEAQRDPAFANLYEATWALIAHEWRATEDPDDGLFSEKSIRRWPNLNDRVRASAEIIDTWVYTQGLGKAQYSLTTAVGLMKSVLSCGLVLGTNALARKWDSSLW